MPSSAHGSAAIEAGACPASRGCRPPAGRGRAPGEARARRHRHQPRDEARPPVADGAARDRHALAAKIVARSRRTPTPDRLGRGRPARVPEPAPYDPGAREADRRGPGRAGGVGTRRGRRPRAVNVEFVSANPTGPLTSATRAAPSSATCCAGSSRPAASGSRASTTSTTRAARSQARRVRRAPTGAASRSPRTATAATTCRLAADVPDEVGRGDRRGRRRRRGRRPLGGRPGPRRIEAWLARPRRPLRRLDERGRAA